MRNLIQVGRECDHVATFIYVSSVLVAQSWDPSVRAFPENEIVDPRTAEGSGYGESKYVAETVRSQCQSQLRPLIFLVTANSQLLAKSGLRGISLRVDQICGSMPSGAWDTSNWIPILVKTSMTMDMIYVRPGIVSFFSVTIIHFILIEWDCSK
jgi:thioester reductase-like protein